MCRIISDQNGDTRSPKRPCTEYRSVLAERNSFASPVKDRLLAFSNLKSKLPPPLQSAFARYNLNFQFCRDNLCFLLCIEQSLYLLCSPTRPNPGGGGETCAETGINIFFGKVLHLYDTINFNDFIKILMI